MASKLGVPFTNDLAALGSNSAISDALIEKAVAAGKSEAQINAAMSSLWRRNMQIRQFSEATATDQYKLLWNLT